MISGVVISAVATLTAIASAVIALVAIRSQRALAKLQSRANVVSASRQRWIDALRDDIAEFLTVDAEQKSFDAWPSQDPAININSIREKNRLLAREMLLFTRIRLRLNPKEPDHNALLGCMTGFSDADEGTTSAIAEQVVKLAQHILKAEWERVKRESSGDMDISSPAFS